MTKILVTGGTGFLGSGLVKQLVKKKNEVVIFDNNFRGNLRNIKDISNKIKFIQGDIRNYKSIKKALKGVTVVYHLAFINGTSYFYDRPKLVMEVGIKGTLNIIDAVNENKNIKKFIYASSSEIYQNPDKFPTSEDVTAKLPNTSNPRYSYASSKILGEVLTFNYLRNNIKKIIFRPHNIYGPSMGFEHVIPEIVKKIMNKSKNLRLKKCNIKIQGSGIETRSFCYIDDASAGIEYIANKGKNNQIYNIGNQREIKIRDLIIKIGKLLGVNVEIQNGKLQTGSSTRRVPNMAKLKKLGFSPKINLNLGLKNTVQWYKNFYIKND